jgi:hypothetical protein
MHGGGDIVHIMDPGTNAWGWGHYAQYGPKYESVGVRMYLWCDGGIYKTQNRHMIKPSTREYLGGVEGVG